MLTSEPAKVMEVDVGNLGRFLSHTPFARSFTRACNKSLLALRARHGTRHGTRESAANHQDVCSNVTSSGEGGFSDRHTTQSSEDIAEQVMEQAWALLPRHAQGRPLREVMFKKRIGRKGGRRPHRSGNPSIRISLAAATLTVLPRIWVHFLEDLSHFAAICCYPNP